MGHIDEKKKQALKDLIRQLHSGVSPEEAKRKFKELLKDVTPLEISEIEQELVEEGMPRDEIRRLCDVHIAVFRDQLEKQRLNVPLSHPVNILMEEHKILLKISQKLESVARNSRDIKEKFSEDEKSVLNHIAQDLKDSEKHYLREENVLFPIMEKHGITEPPTVMWSEHNKIREKEKTLLQILENLKGPDIKQVKERILETACSMNELLADHFYKENNILFPTALRVVSIDEWKQIRKDFDEIGYCCFTPEELTADIETNEAKAKMEAAPEGTWQFETGSMTKEEAEAVLDSLPVDLSFVDKTDAVKYFNKPEKRFFVRTKSVIGRKVHRCHPEKSIHRVKEIVEAFKSGKKNIAEFWINLKDRLIFIRYFAVRGKKGEYLGTLEVTQDITDIKKIKGERRLLDWES